MKPLEEPWQLLRRNTHASIGDSELDLARSTFDCHSHVRRVGAVLQRVTDQVGEHLLDPILLPLTS
jgi:hypothetical protein